MIKNLFLKIGAIAPVVALIAIPLSVNGGVLSFVAKIFGGGNTHLASIKTAAHENSQTVALLQAAEHPDPNPSKGGAEITIVDGEALVADGAFSGTSSEFSGNHSGQISVYVVREGDSLSQIATMFGVSTNTIIWANDLKRGGAIIHEGQVLAILPVSGVKHIVKEGETVKGITKKYDGDYDEVLEYNGFSTNTVLAVGDEVVVPGGYIETPKYTRTTSVVRGTGGPSYSGYYINPLPGSVITQGIHGYNGIDFGASVGTPIVAAAGGQVVISRNGGWNGGYGSYIVISHGNGTQTLYAHLNSGIVYSGQNVVQGQVIGYVGNTGRSTGPHLHFEVRGARNPFAR